MILPFPYLSNDLIGLFQLLHQSFKCKSRLIFHLFRLRWKEQYVRKMIFDVSRIQTSIDRVVSICTVHFTSPMGKFCHNLLILNLPFTKNVLLYRPHTITFAFRAQSPFFETKTLFFPFSSLSVEMYKLQVQVKVFTSLTETYKFRTRSFQHFTA